MDEDVCSTSTVRTAMTVIGVVDIGGTKIAAGLVDAMGRAVTRAEIPTDPAGGFDSAMARTIGLLSEAVQKTGAELQGIGIGCTGPVNPLTGELGQVNFFPDWEKRSPVSVLSKAFGVGAAMENDADAAALAEAAWGAGKGKSRLIFVTIGTGIGGGIILDGRLYRGVDGLHGEIGHHVVEASGPSCSCGARGCWESVASGPAISDWLKQNAPAGSVPSNITARDICARAKEGDAWSLRAVERASFYLGVGLANLINLFAPDALVLGGSVMKSAELFLDGIRSTIRQNCRLVPYDRTSICLSLLGSDAGLIGAAEVWRHHFENRKEEA